MIEPAPVKMPGQPVHFLDAQNHHCRAVVATAYDNYAIFCGEMKRPGSSWCPDHFKLFTVPPQPPRSHHRKET